MRTEGTDAKSLTDKGNSDPELKIPGYKTPLRVLGTLAIIIDDLDKGSDSKSECDSL